MCPELGKLVRWLSPTQREVLRRKAGSFSHQEQTGVTCGDPVEARHLDRTSSTLSPLPLLCPEHISCEPLVFVSKQFVLGVEQTNSMFSFSLFAVLIVLSIHGQASALGFDIPETYVYSWCHCSQMTPHIGKCPGPLLILPAPCVSPPEFPCFRKQSLPLQTLLHFPVLCLKTIL